MLYNKITCKVYMIRPRVNISLDHISINSFTSNGNKMYNNIHYVRTYLYVFFKHF